MSTFGDKIKQARWNRGWSQEKLAEHLGADRRTIQRWEQNQMPPSPRYIEQLISFFEKPPEDFGLPCHPPKKKASASTQIETQKTQIEQAQTALDLRLTRLEHQVLQLEQQLDQLKEVLRQITGNRS